MTKTRDIVMAAFANSAAQLLPVPKLVQGCASETRIAHGEGTAL